MRSVMLIWVLIGGFTLTGLWILWADQKRRREERRRRLIRQQDRLARLAREYENELSEFDRRRHGQSGLK